MSWKTIRADQFCDSVRDGTHDTPKEVESGYKLVTSKHIREGQVYPDEAYNISEKDYLKINERSKVEQWDVIMSMIGNGLGRTAVIKETPAYAIKNLALFKIGNEVKAKWLHYFLSSEYGQGLIYNSLQGSGQPFISLNLLRSFPVPRPPYEIMERIVRYLEKYDDLIENNKGQIKLLEEASQRLYKEWFLDFRFPGHKNTPIVDGMPQGWSKRPIGDIIEKSYRSKQVMASDYLKEGIIPIIDQSRDFIAGYTNDEETLVCLNRPVIVFGDHTRILKYIQFPFAKGADGTQLILSNCENLPQPLLYLSLQNVDLSNYHYARHFKYLKAEKIVVPDIDVAKAFEEMINPMFKKIQTMRDQIRNAQQARDRLLPKLMSGEIEV